MKPSIPELHNPEIHGPEVHVPEVHGPEVHGLEVHGLDLDPETRCQHWHSPLDIVAIRMACCGLYYACKDCHQALADHPLKPWPRSAWHTPAILCGRCKTELTIETYMASNNHCPNCNAPFNPGCRHHYDFYFATESETCA